MPESLQEPSAHAGQSLVDVTMAGINFADLRHRAGQPEPLDLPAVLGAEIVGRRRSDGRRVAALMRELGGYAEVAAMCDAHTVEIPDGISDLQACALLEQGNTAYAALVIAGRLAPGETVAVTAAAGGVGHLALQIAHACGAGRVIGLASTRAKQEFVRELGADVVAGHEELRAVDLIVDTVGGELLRPMLDSLAPFGRLVSVGSRTKLDALGIEDDLGVRSVGVTGFWMKHVLEDRRLYEKITGEVFRLALEERLVGRIDRLVPLCGVADAHQALADRRTMGKVLIDVSQ